MVFFTFMNARCSILGLLLITVASAGEKADDGAVSGGNFSRSSQANPHWSFQPVQRPELPIPVDGEVVRNGIDAFLLDQLQRAKITPSPEASPTTLIRRVTLDLIGLPPTLEEVDHFLRDEHPDRYERLVDRLLASPHYGERWANAWLDLCHYADTDGYLTDQARPVAWRYRSWLIDALNRNLPFDKFTVQQLAGDLLPGATDQQRIATGFLRQTLSNREGGAEPEEFRVKQVVDRVEMVGTIWLGLTVGCAQCHDHKYDPLAQHEFFGLYACLNNADEINIDVPLPDEAEAFFASRGHYQAKRQELLEPVREELIDLLKRWETKCLHARDNPGEDHVWDRRWEVLGLIWGGKLGEGQLEGQEILKLAWPRRSARQLDDLIDYFVEHGSIIDPEAFKRLELSKLGEQLKALKEECPQATRAPVMQAALTPRPTYLHRRGDFRDRGEPVEPALPGCLPSWHPSQEDPRLPLARWLVSHDNPLTARVTVNRMWQEFFGRGLVVTTEDFGTRGQRPAHPQLLDWLAHEFMESGWDMKTMHRLIVCAATYRRSSTPRHDLVVSDPENILLARQTALRLPAESVRDAGLAVSGLLHRRIGGPSVRPSQPESVVLEGYGKEGWTPSPAPDCYRRGIYTYKIRTTPFAQSVTFDAPNPNAICTRRGRSNTPLQALTLLNDPVFFEMAQALTDRILQEASPNDADRITYGFRLCMARPPTPQEHSRLTKYYQSQFQHFSQDNASVENLLDWEFTADVTGAEQVATTHLCSVLLNLHECITRD